MGFDNLNITINGNVGTINKDCTIIQNQQPQSRMDDIPEAEIVEEEEDNKPLTFEDAIPEHLRTGLFCEVWIRLVKAGFLNDDKTLAQKTTKVAAQYIARSFFTNSDRVEWSHFERFWGLQNLRYPLGEPKESDKNAIDKIFCIF